MKFRPVNDLLASIVVFLVALPLSLGIALASGAPPLAGLISAAVGGIAVGLTGGAPMQVSGPAAGLTMLVFVTVQNLGWAGTCAAVLLAGLIQVVLGFLKIARASLAITPSVVHGMLAGIGITIAIAQTVVVLGAKAESKAIDNLKAMPGLIAGGPWPSLALGLAAIAVLVLWPRLPRSLQTVPAPLVAVVLPTVASVAFNLKVDRIKLPTNLVDGFTLIRLPETENWTAIITAALTIAAVASVESLLSAVATDKMHEGPKANLDKELIGQGVANTIAGVLGGLPVTGVIVRSSANIRAGATSRLSAILHGVWVIVFVALLGSLLKQIPLAVLAGLLVHVGVRLVDRHHIKELAKHRELPIYIVTTLGVVFLGLLNGVGIGFALAAFVLLRRMGHADIRVTNRGSRYRVIVDGALTFLTVPKLIEAFGKLPKGAGVDIDLHVDFMDHAAFEALHDWETSHRRSGGDVTISEHREEWYRHRSGPAPRVQRTPKPAVES